MIAVACIFSALFYSLLLIVPSVDRTLPLGEKGPSLKFNCDRRGAMVRSLMIKLIDKYKELRENDIHLKNILTVYIKFLY